MLTKLLDTHLFVFGGDFIFKTVSLHVTLLCFSRGRRVVGQLLLQRVHLLFRQSGSLQKLKKDLLVHSCVVTLLAAVRI